MDKKGAEFAVGTVIMIVLGLIVLVIVAMVVKQQVTKGSKSYDDIGSSVGTQADRCASLIEGRSCGATCPQGYTELTGTWTDCGTKKCCKKND